MNSTNCDKTAETIAPIPEPPSPKDAVEEAVLFAAVVKVSTLAFNSCTAFVKTAVNFG